MTTVPPSDWLWHYISLHTDLLVMSQLFSGTKLIRLLIYWLLLITCFFWILKKSKAVFLKLLRGGRQTSSPTKLFHSYRMLFQTTNSAKPPVPILVVVQILAPKICQLPAANTSTFRLWHTAAGEPLSDCILQLLKENRIIDGIMSKKNPANLLNEDKTTVSILQNNLDEIYKIRAKGASVRSRLKWLEEGERNSSFFFRLENHRAKSNLIEQLNMDGTATTDSKTIVNYCCSFCSKHI